MGDFAELLQAVGVAHLREVEALRSELSNLKELAFAGSERVPEAKAPNGNEKMPEEAPDVNNQQREDEKEGENNRTTSHMASIAQEVLNAETDEKGPEEFEDITLFSRSRAHMGRTVMRKFEVFLESNMFELILMGLLTANVLFMAVQLQLEGLITGQDIAFYAAGNEGLLDYKSWGDAQHAMVIVDRCFSLLFALDVSTRVIVLRNKFWRSRLNWIDLFTTVCDVITQLLVQSFPIEPNQIRLLRLVKLARALRVVTMHSVLEHLNFLVKCLMASSVTLLWSLTLLVFFQCVTGMIISNLCKRFLEQPSTDPEGLKVQREVFAYYGTFSRTFLTTFEIFFANWAPPCRILVDHVSEWFLLVFIVYRCVIGFAILNVVNSVFIQSTMKIAQSDDEHMFKLKMKEQSKYTQLVKDLFRRLDVSGDGMISVQEFHELLAIPRLQFWLNQLDVHYHDLLGLFELLDDGDGLISLNEFLNGVTRMKGTAKCIDVWRLETKLEALLFKLLRGKAKKNEMSLAEILENEGLKHQPSRHLKPSQQES
eukprot:TRINITY_DN16787_c1_g2_i1.p1 TRINITY_DN16787_c1_g2~~TRINITY_DN16787_c1_g2_i1.p1  ORF type:complete len:620 (+),score=112.68 TRINITY_DN16787_c1_g2_i1:242-1861(+)